jgi:hypothetical protein
MAKLGLLHSANRPSRQPEDHVASDRSQSTGDVRPRPAPEARSSNRSFKELKALAGTGCASKLCAPRKRTCAHDRPKRTGRPSKGQELNAKTAATAGRGRPLAGRPATPGWHPCRAHRDKPRHGREVGDTKRPATAHARASTPGCPAAQRPRQCRPRCRRRREAQRCCYRRNCRRRASCHRG